MQSMHQTDLKSQDKLKACPTRLMVSSLEQAPQKRREVGNRIVPLQQVLDFLVSDGQVRILRMLLGSVSARSGNFPEKIGCLVRCHVCALFYYSAPVSSSKSLPRHKHVHYCEVLTHEDAQHQSQQLPGSWPSVKLSAQGARPPTNAVIHRTSSLS